jgi:hypothetical protein
MHFNLSFDYNLYNRTFVVYYKTTRACLRAEHFRRQERYS